MKRNYPVLFWLPEIYLTFATIYYWAASSLFNPIAIFLFSSLILLMFIRNKIIGIVLSIVFILFTQYMLLALLSDLMKTPDSPYYNEVSVRIAPFFMVYLLLTLVTAVVMAVKWYNVWAQPQQRVF